MMDYITTNVITTVTMLIAVKLISRAPARLKLILLLLGLMNWFVPWHKIELIRSSDQTALANSFQALIPSISEYFPVNNLASALPNSQTPVAQSGIFDTLYQGGFAISFKSLFVAMMLFGLIGFVFDVVRYYCYINKLNASASNAAHLLQRYGIGIPLIFNRRVNIKASPFVPTAMATGTIKPTIWLNDEVLSSPQLHSMVLHEYTHLQQFDPSIKWVMQFAKRLFWWNPLVYLLIRKIDLLIEVSCDQRCYRIRHDEYSVDLAEIMLSNHNNPNRLAFNISGFTSVKGHANNNIARLKSLTQEVQLKSKFVVLAIFAVMGSSLACARINSSAALIQPPVITDDIALLHQMALRNKARRASEKMSFNLFREDSAETAEYNKQMRKLVALSKNALSADLNVLDDAFQGISNWLVTRKPLPQIQEKTMLFHAFAVQHFLLQQQQKNAEIVDLVIGIFGSLDAIPRAYRHKTATALLHLQQTEDALRVLQQFNPDRPNLPFGNLRLMAEAYVKSGQYEHAVTIIDKQMVKSPLVRQKQLLSLKYQVLKTVGLDDQAEEIKVLLAEKFKHTNLPKRNLYQNSVGMHWAPVLDYI